MKSVGDLIKIRSLKWQLLLRLFMLLIVLLTIMEITQYFMTKDNLFSNKEQQLISKLHSLDDDNLGNINSDEEVKKHLSDIIKDLSDKDMEIAIIDSKGNVIRQVTGRSKENMPPLLSGDNYKEIIKKSDKYKNYKILKDKEGCEQIVMWNRIGSKQFNGALIQISYPTDSVYEILNKQLIIYLFTAILIILIGVILGKKVINFSLKPLYDMSNTVEKITVGQLDTRLSCDNGQVEIDRLSNAFNGMLQRIEKSFEKEEQINNKMRQFVSDASHELRTPLTSIHGFVEVLLRGAAKNEKQLNQALNSILIESDRLTKLVNDLLLLIKLDQQIQVKMKEEDIGEIIKEIAPQLRIIAKERELKLNIKENISTKVNRDQMKQVIFNLVQNSIQHTDEVKGVINISLDIINDKAASKVILKISDNGTGISQNELDAIFDRFFRSERHRSRKYGGFGLGLAIVKSIIDEHKGKIIVESDIGIGTSFSICI